MREEAGEFIKVVSLRQGATFSYASFTVHPHDFHVQASQNLSTLPPFEPLFADVSTRCCLLFRLLGAPGSPWASGFGGVRRRDRWGGVQRAAATRGPGDDFIVSMMRHILPINIQPGSKCKGTLGVETGPLISPTSIYAHRFSVIPPSSRRPRKMLKMSKYHLPRRA